jgi:putative CocE/NonD family hydrolase
MRLMHKFRPVALGLAVLLATAAPAVVGYAQSAPAAAVEAKAPDLVLSFDKTTAMVPMRDGTKLYTEIFTPKNATGKLPVLLVRTPYGASGQDTVTEQGSPFAHSYGDLARDGYIFAFQDTRGRYKSEGDFVMVRAPHDPKDKKGVDEATDAWDTVDWLVKNAKGNSGKVGMMGVSYPAWLTVMASADPHPALKAVSPQASPADVYLYDDFGHNGAFRLSYGFEYVAVMERGRENNLFNFDALDGYDWYLRQGALGEIGPRWFSGGQGPTWDAFTKHPDYDDYWRQRSTLTHMKPIKVPTLTVGGWFDQEDGAGPLELYKAWAKNDPKGLNYLVMGPWKHGSWEDPGKTKLGDIDFGSDTATHFQKEILVPWFAYYLKDRRDGPAPAKAVMFETGANQWRSLDNWSGQGVGTDRNLYLRAGGKLSFEAPTEAEAADVYVSDPAKPVPYRARPVKSTFTPGSGWGEWLVSDQRFVDGRPDVLTWTTEPLTEDLAISGDITAHLFAATTGSDSDFVVKLIDVYPDQDADAPEMGGYQLMVSGEILRGRYRKGFETAVPITPGKVENYDIDLHQRLHRFKKGHRIMVQVQSSWFPLYDRNPQTFVPNIFQAKAGDYKAATQSIQRSAASPSHISLRVSN